jgi:TPR repeat protein
MLFEVNNKPGLAEEYLLQAVDCGNVHAMNHLGVFYKQQGRLQLAEKYYFMAAEKFYHNAIFNLGLLYKEQKRYSAAEE